MRGRTRKKDGPESRRKTGWEEGGGADERRSGRKGRGAAGRGGGGRGETGGEEAWREERREREEGEGEVDGRLR